MFGLFKPEKHKYVTNAEFELEIQRLEDEIVEIGERVSLSNRRVAAEEARASKAVLEEPIPQGQIEELVKNLPQAYQGVALAFLSTPKGQKMAFDVIKGLMR